MTNYRHGQMIQLIGTMDSPLLEVQPGRCLLVRHRNADCLRCASVCTTGAISLSDEGVAVNPEACIGCGTCASACPTGCLTAANPTDEELFATVAGALARTGRVALACERALGAAFPPVPGTVAGTSEDGAEVVAVVCLGRVDESLLVEATARGARKIALISGPCEQCPHRAGGQLCDAIVQSAESLLAALAVTSPVRRRRLEDGEIREGLRLRPTASAQDDAEDDSLPVFAPVERQGHGPCPTNEPQPDADSAEAGRKGMSGGAHQASSAACIPCTRGLSERLSITRQPDTDEPQPGPATDEKPSERRKGRVDASVRTALVPGANKGFTSQFPHVQADGTLPHFVPPRRRRLFNSLRALNAGKQPAAEEVSTRLWGQVTIDTELCRSCRMCTVFCPTGAVSRFDTDEGAFGVEHRSALCMQCRLCETICPEDALTVSASVSLPEFLSGEKFRFTMQPVGWNPGAEDAIASRMARFIKVDNMQEPQAKVKSNDTAERRAYAQQREARRREIRGE